MMLLIVNPVAGHGKAMRLADKASSLLGNCRTVYTNAPGHATELAREAARSGAYEAVVAMGGDGTVSETAAGLRDTEVPLGILPAGRATTPAADMAFRWGWSRRWKRSGRASGPGGHSSGERAHFS